MKRAKQHSGVWQYLQSTGVLEHGTQEAIQAARKEYWRLYKRRWKQDKHKAYTVSLTTEESKELARVALAHHTTPTAFIKQALFAYIHTSFVVPDAEAVQEIRILLARNYLLLQTMSEDGTTPELPAHLLPQMERLEQEVLQRLIEPLPLEKYVAQVVAKHPAQKEHLLELLQSGVL